MARATARPAVRVRFRYNVETGTIEQFVVDDQAPERSERYHDGVAETVAAYLGRRPEIADAGPRDLLDEPPTGELREDLSTPEGESEPELDDE